ncbi:MAG: 50S ribosomal protein L13 [Malacoplasma sp.]
MQKTTFLKKEQVMNKNWYIVDATNAILGKLSVEVANLLRGKNKVDFTPNVDCGDNVIIINSAQIKLSSNKAEKEKWHNHSGFIGGLRTRSGKEMIEKYSDELIFMSIKNMMPRNKLSNHSLRKLHIYKNANYPQTAQQPIPYELKDFKK